MSRYDRSASVARRKRALTPDLGVCGLEEKLSLSAMIASAVITPAPTLVTVPVGTGTVSVPVQTNDPSNYPAPVDAGGNLPGFETDPGPAPTGADVNELFPWQTPDGASLPAAGAFTKNPPSSTDPMTNPLDPMSGVPGTNIGVLAPTMTILPASNPPETSPLQPGQIMA